MSRVSRRPPLEAAIGEGFDAIEIFPRRNVAQRECGSYHVRRRGTHGAELLQEGVAKASLEEDGGQGCGRYDAQTLACQFIHGSRFLGLELRGPCAPHLSQYEFVLGARIPAAGGDGKVALARMRTHEVEVER